MSATTPRSVRRRCHYFGLGQFHRGVFAHFNIGGNSYGCQLFSVPTLAVADEDLYLHAADGARGETLISGPLRAALRTVREVERLADAVENLPDDKPALALLDGWETLAFWDLQRLLERATSSPQWLLRVLLGPPGRARLTDRAGCGLTMVDHFERIPVPPR